MIPENVMMYDVQSSNIRQIGYDEENQVIYVVFYDPKGVKADSIYWYAGVVDYIWDAFLAAPSKGQFVWQNLRGQYEYGRLV